MTVDNPRHVAAGIAAVIDSATIGNNTVTTQFVHVDPGDIAAASNVFKKLTGSSDMTIHAQSIRNPNRVGIKLRHR